MATVLVFLSSNVPAPDFEHIVPFVRCIRFTGSGAALSHNRCLPHWPGCQQGPVKANPMILKGTYVLSQKLNINNDSTAIF